MIQELRKIIRVLFSVVTGPENLDKLSCEDTYVYGQVNMPKSIFPLFKSIFPLFLRAESSTTTAVSPSVSTRALLRRGWRRLRQASQRRAVLVRAVGVSSRARSRRLGFALCRWRTAANDNRTAELRTRAAWSVLAACRSGARARAMRPAWESWRELVEREREEEDEFAGREEGLLAFASVITRVGRRRDRDRRLRAFGVWRLGAARSAVTVARQQVARGSEVVRAVEVENVSLFGCRRRWGGRR